MKVIVLRPQDLPQIKVLGRALPFWFIREVAQKGYDMPIKQRMQVLAINALLKQCCPIMSLRIGSTFYTSYMIGYAIYSCLNNSSFICLICKINTQTDADAFLLSM